ncbi:Cytosine/purine/uracil/thiamine/allantoin permease family protein [hydrothermal vent metagenome]|uniref:Cytosine/purine/uracil/thiamine/allantoin permease family protein n=1 Tax=hydrothermal vent metagenome TaxID=652676 RepID=A0A3B0W8Y0_9ZZZZ
MRPLGIFICFLAICLLVSALLHYPLHLLLEGLIEMPAHKQVTRFGKLLMLPGFFLLIRWLDLYSREALGFGEPRPLFLRQMVIGWFFGILILTILTGTLTSLGIRVLKPFESPFFGDVIKTLSGGLLAGLLVGIVEESFFRGALFQAIRRRGPAISAIIFSSLLYASVHFIKPLPLEGPVGWFSGLQILSGAFWQFGEWATFDSFLALFMAGVFLALVRERTGSIACCIGLHAGWVLVIKCTKDFTYTNPASKWAFLTGDYDSVTGYLAAGLLGVLALGYWIKGTRLKAKGRI